MDRSSPVPHSEPLDVVVISGGQAAHCHIAEHTKSGMMFILFVDRLTDDEEEPAETRFTAALCRASRQPDDVVGVRMTMVPRHDECVHLTELSWPPC